MDQDEKKTWKENATEKIKEQWEKTKKFCIDHKDEIVIGVFASVMSIIGKNMSDDYSYSSSDKNSDDNYSYWNLRKKSFDELNDIREDVRLDYQNPQREKLLNVIDKARAAVGNPRIKHARSLSDDELQTEYEEAQKLYYEEYEIDRKDKRPYEEKRLDEVYKQHSIDYDNFSQLKIEKDRRYAAEHPDEFPVHREHGWYLPEDDD